jgi:NADH dehydrogenase/NADH:ubiquinone oxidoreductase subunit G
MAEPDTLTITIDGRDCACEKGEFLLDIATRNSIYIPTLCNHPGLEGLGACRVCIVEVVERGKGKIVVSCIYPVERECEVFTANDKVLEQRRTILMLLGKLAPNSERIRAISKHYKAPALPRLENKPDGDRCILCGRCVQACNKLGTGAIAAVNRGIAKEIATPYHEPSKACIGCASCAEVCPTDAIPVTQDAQTRTIWGRTFVLAHCSSCGADLNTQEVLQDVARKTGQEPDMLCDACRKRTIADTFAATYSR